MKTSVYKSAIVHSSVQPFNSLYFFLKNVIFYSVQKPYTGFYKYRGPKSDRASVRGHIIFPL